MVVGRRYSVTEPGAVPRSDQVRVYGLRRRKGSAPDSARPNVLWFGRLVSLSVQYCTVGCTAESPQGRFAFMSCAGGGRRICAEGQAEGARCTDGGRCTEGVLCAEGGPTWRITVLCHARDRADRCVMETVGGSAVLHQRGKSQCQVRASSEARDLPWRDAERPVMNSTMHRWPR